MALFENEKFKDPWTAMLSVIEVGVYGNGDSDEWCTDGMTEFLFHSLKLVITVVLLNMLVAIMGETFMRVQEKAVLEAMFEKASIIIETEHSWLPTLHLYVPEGWKSPLLQLTGLDLRTDHWCTENFPQWLHVLVSRACLRFVGVDKRTSVSCWQWGEGPILSNSTVYGCRRAGETRRKMVRNGFWSYLTVSRARGSRLRS